MTDETLKAAVAAVRRHYDGAFPKIAMILGSGLGRFGEAMKVDATIPYGEIPGFPESTVPGHEGKLLIGSVDGVPIVCMQGRMHLYEGYPAPQLAVSIRTLKLLGAETLILTNASGSLHKDMGPGSLMLIRDHINLSGHNPLTGPNHDDLGPRFVDMSQAYDAALRDEMKVAAEAQAVRVHEGVYVQVAGPNFETPAEIKMLSILGGDAVGMSTVPECLVARHCGMRVLGLSLVTNLAAGIAEHELSHQETMDEAAKAYDQMRSLMIAFLKRIHE